MAMAAERLAVGAANVSWVDRFYRRVVRNIFFADGFGDLTKLDGVLELKRNAATLARRPLRVLSMKRVDGDGDRQDGVTCWEGRFVSPVEEVAPGLLPPECRTVGFQFIEPRARGNRAVVHLPATGDHSYWRRRLLVAMPLARQRNVASVIPENPLYGARKPTNQLRSNLRCVMDLYLMGVAIQFESVALLHWLEEQGYDHLGINGLSMGGHMASMVAATWPKALAHVSCLGPFTASGTRAMIPTAFFV